VDPHRDDGLEEPVRGLNRTTIGLIAGLILLVLVIGYFATRGNLNQDKLTNVTASQTSAPSPEKLCANKATYDLIKRELFRRAAQLRGSDQAAYDQISSSAVVRMDNPVMESQDSATGAVHCSASLSLDLPPGVAVVGGRRTLTADIDYSVQQAADSSGPVVLLQNADTIITPLATLTKTAEPPAEASAPPDENDTASQPSDDEQAQQEQPAPSPTRTGDPTLDALNHNLTVEFGRAVAVATPEQRELLRQTARRFDAYRERCPDRRCVAAAYAGRIREIHDIVEGRWQPPR
jgi:hypothetical protein